MSDEYLSKAKQDIDRWEHEGPSWLAQVGDFILWPATKAADLLIPNGVQDAVGKSIEGVLVGISNLSDSTFSQADVQTEWLPNKRHSASRAICGSSLPPPTGQRNTTGTGT